MGTYKVKFADGINQNFLRQVTAADCTEIFAEISNWYDGVGKNPGLFAQGTKFEVNGRSWKFSGTVDRANKILTITGVI